MAGVTQTVDTYYAGMSSQPDLKKFPGQVTDIVNGIPDPIEGLYKRPGSQRVGTVPLATNKYGTSSVPSGGSWFHYYRDETEGSYIGQVAANGLVRVWSCTDGTEKNVWYHTDNSTYAGSVVGGSDANHTSITDYLSASDTEDVQALTINDTTYLNNRDTTVTTTGTTPTREHTHFAYLEILRAENGRQYALNLSNNDNNNLTTIRRATRLRISSDTLDEENGSGHCPGIGSQVFSSTTGDKGPLIFRIDVLGQQGQGAAVDDGSTDASNYKCSYSRKVTLLHGGENWQAGNTTTVTLNQAQTNYNYTVRVEDHERLDVKANVALCRPVPTPFDAETAVTVDSIIGGIRSEIASAVSIVIIGNGMYLYSNSTAFNVEVVEKDLMRVMQETINDVSELPSQCRHGYIVKVTNSQDSNDDDYYLKFEGNNGEDGPGSWVECAAPGIVKGLSASKMPHILQRQSDGDFLVKKNTWGEREVGDDNTNPLPSFADGASKINKVLFFRNRLALLSGESVILSRPGELSTPNYFAKTALAVSAIDPIDISCSSMFPSDLFDGLEVAAGLAVFSTNQQFLLSSDAEVLNPDTAKLRSISTYNYNKDVPPMSLGTTIGYIDNSGKYSRFNEMANVVREQEPTVMETSKLVSNLLPKDINLTTNSRENQIVLFGKSDTDLIYGYKYLVSGEERPQTAWFKWKLNNPIRYHFIIDDEYFFLDTDNFLQKISLVQQTTDPDIDQDGINYMLHLDNWTSVTGGTWNSNTNRTLFADGVNGTITDWIDEVTTPNGTLVLIDAANAHASRTAKYAECTITNTDDFTVPGDWTSGSFYIGYLYEYKVQFPTIYMTQSQGKQSRSDVNSSLVVHRVKLNFGKSGLYETTLQRKGKTDYTEIYESTFADDYEASDAPYVPEQVQTVPVYEKNTNVDIILKSSHPSPAVLHAMSWEGDYTPKNYRRV